MSQDEYPPHILRETKYIADFLMKYIRSAGGSSGAGEQFIAVSLVPDILKKAPGINTPLDVRRYGHHKLAPFLKVRWKECASGLIVDRTSSAMSQTWN